MFNTAWQAGECSSHTVIGVVAIEIFHTLLLELNEKPDSFGILLLLLAVTGLDWQLKWIVCLTGTFGAWFRRSEWSAMCQFACQRDEADHRPSVP